MIEVACDFCGTDDAELFAQRPPRADVLHERFVRCRRCGGVYASPRAEPEEAQSYYSRVASRGAVSLDSEPAEKDWRHAVSAWESRLDEAAARLQPMPRAPRFLEVGFGDASALAAALSRGWEIHGVEYSDWLVDRASRRLGATTFVCGGIEDARFAAGSFDVVFSWHVIEHVLNVNAWLAEIRRVLQPGGVLVLGTENAESLYGKLWIAAFRAARRAPWPPTSTDHTYWFSRGSLGMLLTRHGFTETEVRGYENSPMAIARAVSPRALLRPAPFVSFSLYLTGALASLAAPALGGKLVAYANAGSTS